MNTKRVFSLLVNLFLLIFLLTGNGGLVRAEYLSTGAGNERSSKNAAVVQASTLVLVNSASSNYLDFQRLIQPYLDQFGIPYTVLNIQSAPLPSTIGDYAVLIVGHRQLDVGNLYLDSTEEGYILAAVNGGTGLVNFDNDLSIGGVPRYGFIQSIFNFGYGGSTLGSGIILANPASHYILQRHTGGEVISTGQMNFGGLTLPSDASSLAMSGTQPFLAVRSSGSGRAVQWGSYDWMSNDVKGAVFGLDDLVWRSIVWAARKPFVMQGMPPFVTLRVEDVAGPLNWAHAASEAGFKPWLGILVNYMDAIESIDLSELVNSNRASASVYGLSNPDYLYFDHFGFDGGTDFSEARLTEYFNLAKDWHTFYNIPISKYVGGKSYEFGTNVFSRLENWGVEFIGTVVAPGSYESTSNWLQLGPYRKYSTGAASLGNSPFHYSDFLPITNHPELDGKFFNCITEIRDISGYEWIPNNYNLTGSIDQGTSWLKRGLDSMVLATLFSRENSIHTISEANWQTIIQGIVDNLAAYRPRFVTLEVGCRYARAMHTSNILSTTFDTDLNQLTTTFTGSSDIPTEYYVFIEDNGQIIEWLLGGEMGVPAFSGSTTVTFRLPGTLHHIQVIPSSISMVPGEAYQFTAQGYDSADHPIPGLTYDWSVVNGGGAIDPSGLFTAGQNLGSFNNTVIVSVGSITGSASVTVVPAQLHHFSFDIIPSPQYANVPFSITITARDSANNIVETFNQTVQLSDPTGTISPALSGSFINGRWTGNVSIATDASVVQIQAVNGAYSGISNGFRVRSAPACPITIWEGGGEPAIINNNAGAPIELGVKFLSEVDGFIRGIRFYKGDQNTGEHVGHLWSLNGELLAEAAFTNETQSGWQEVLFSTPVPITAHTTYVASYFSPEGHYSNSISYFYYNGHGNPPLHALADGMSGANGVFRAGSSGFPSDHYMGSNYWVDVVFCSASNPVNHPPVANDQSVTTAEDTSVAITLTASDVDGDPLTWTVVDNPGHGSLSGTAPNLTYTPQANYHGSDSFTFRVNDGTVNSNLATVTITITPVYDPSDVEISLKGLSVVNPYSVFTHTISVTNLGPDAVSGVTMVDHFTLPAGTEVISITQPAGWTCSNIGVDGVLTCSTANLNAGGNALIEVVLRSPLIGGVVIQSNASVSTVSEDPILGNNQKSMDIVVPNIPPTGGLKTFLPVIQK